MSITDEPKKFANNWNWLDYKVYKSELIKDVQAENEHMWLRAFAIIGEFLEENVKLRELARDTFGGYKGAVKMLPPSYSKNVAEMAVMDISDRMRELGIEV